MWLQRDDGHDKMNVKIALELPFQTPHMVVDFDQVNENIKKMQEIARRGEKRLRPHSKTHKIPELSRIQIGFGAIGICIQKVSEAEVMFNGGIGNLLLSNEVLGQKIRRCADLISEGANLTLGVDNEISTKQFSSACKVLGIEGHVIIDIDIGMNRCGIDPLELEGLLGKIKNLPNILIDGIMAYDGHVNFPDRTKREKEVRKEERVLSRVVSKLKNNGVSDPVVTVGGTPTAEIWADSEIANELQPGTYVYFDTHCVNLGLCTMKDIAIAVVATATSEKVENRLVLDAGYKSVSLDQGVYPTVIDEGLREYDVISMSEEHTVVKVSDNVSRLGKKFIILPYHSCTTTDLWDSTYLISSQKRPRKIIIEGRGKRE